MRFFARIPDPQRKAVPGFFKGAVPPPPPPMARAAILAAAAAPPVPAAPIVNDSAIVLTEAVQKFPVGEKVFCGLEVDHNHLQQRIVEMHEHPDMEAQLKDVDSNRLPQLVAERKWEDFLQYGVSYYGTQMFDKPEAMTPNLEALAKYAETDPKAAPDIRAKLRFVTKCVLENPDCQGLVVMLAAHGGVCNVMKEVGIRHAYASLANTMKSECDASDPKNVVLRLLYDLRELCCEQLYYAQFCNGKAQYPGAPAINTHDLARFSNEIAKQIGLREIPDPNISYGNEEAKKYVGLFFERFYHLHCMIGCIQQALNEAPRKLDYNAVVSFLQYNRPVKFGADGEEFLFHCFDVDGRFTAGAIAWMLFRMGVLKLAEGVTEVDEEALFPKLDDDAKDQIRASRDRLNASLTASSEMMLNKSGVIPEEIQLASSAASLHLCEGCQTGAN